MTCPACGRPVIGYVYDANGWKTWCGSCGAPLNHQPRRAAWQVMANLWRRLRG